MVIVDTGVVDQVWLSDQKATSNTLASAILAMKLQTFTINVRAKEVSPV